MSNEEMFNYPFYAHPCSEVKEDHARHVIVHQYVGCIKISNQWAVPSNESAVWVTVPALVEVMIGSCLWNPEYGYFRVAAFDSNANKIQLQRLDRSDTTLPGRVIPFCTKFIFVAEPV